MPTIVALRQEDLIINLSDVHPRIRAMIDRLVVFHDDITKYPIGSLVFHFNQDSLKVKLEVGLQLP